MKRFNTIPVISISILLGAYLIGCDGRSSPKESAKREVRHFSAIAKILPPNQKFSMGGKCNMETINGGSWGTDAVVVHQADVISVTGWGVDDQAKRTPRSVFLRVQTGNRVFYSEAEGVERADVAQYFKEDYYKNSGYQANVSLAGLSPGEYQAMIVMTFSDKAVLCASGRTLILK